jgi:ABC-2 type transport system permease protein
VNFYAPSVLALILQHIAITLGALSIVREKERGTLEMFRVAPVSSSSVILGKYLGYAVFLALLAGALVILLVLLGTPLQGDIGQLSGLLFLLIIASLGIGFLISCISNSDSTAVQLSMLMLLISIFFSGFFLPLENFAPAMQTFTLLVPLTHGIQALQEIMLKGNPPHLINWIMLAAIAVASYIVVQFLFRRQLKHL